MVQVVQKNQDYQDCQTGTLAPPGDKSKITKISKITEILENTSGSKLPAECTFAVQAKYIDDIQNPIPQLTENSGLGVQGLYTNKTSQHQPCRMAPKRTKLNPSLV